MTLNRLIMCVSLLFLVSTAQSSTRFIVNNFEEAREKAQAEGKMLLLDFYASWCAPCRFMETTTFKDERVSSLLNDKFVPLKIDIDDFDGYALKEHFDIRVLPTFIIFGSDGKVIERIEETLSPTNMVNLLEKNLASYKPSVKPVNMAPGVAKETAEAAPNRYQATYKIQLGMYSSYDATLKFYTRMSKRLEDPVIILHDYKGGNVMYRVLIGNFQSTEDAHYYLSDLKKDHGINGHIYI